MRIAYQEWFEYKKINEEKLANFENWSNEKMFFLSYVNVLCSATNKIKSEKIKYDRHLPSKYEINIPLSNFEAFADAYKCKSGLKINQKKLRV